MARIAVAACHRKKRTSYRWVGRVVVGVWIISALIVVRRVKYDRTSSEGHAYGAATENGGLIPGQLQPRIAVNPCIDKLCRTTTRDIYFPIDAMPISKAGLMVLAEPRRVSATKRALLGVRPSILTLARALLYRR